MKYYAYIRVSTREQNTDRQHIAMNEYEKANGITLVRFEDKQSGKDFNREHYQALKAIVKAGDTIVIKELDRLGRNYEEIKKELAYFQSIGVNVRILDLPVLDVKDTTLSTMLTNLMLELLSYVAQKELEKNHIRSQEGIANAKAKGVKFGRPAAILPKEFEKYYNKYKSDEITGVEFSKLLSVSRTTLYRYIDMYEKGA